MLQQLPPDKQMQVMQVQLRFQPAPMQTLLQTSIKQLKATVDQLDAFKHYLLTSFGLSRKNSMGEGKQRMSHLVILPI